MAGRRSFTGPEIDELRRLIREKQTADRDRQKFLREKMRRIGFYITDFADYSGFTASDFDDLLDRGVITCSDTPARAGALPRLAGDPPPTSLAGPRPSASTQAPGASSLAWYEELRERYRPARINVLLIAESPPDPGAGDRRFFYAPTLSYDNLYRGVAESVYGGRDDLSIGDKVEVLERLRDDGFWLIDAVEDPINKTSPAARRRAIADGVPRLVGLCQELQPERGVIICHGLVYELAAPALRAAGVPLLHDVPLPFPLGNWRARFVAEMRRALASRASNSKR